MFFRFNLQFDLEQFISKNCKHIFSTRNMYILGENTSKCCSRITEVHVHATVFSKVHPACHNIVNGIKPGSNSKRTSKDVHVCWGVK